VRLFVLRLLCAAMAGFVGNLSAGARAAGSSAVADYAELALAAPSAAGLTICHGFGCRARTEIAFSAADRTKMAQILRAGQGSPASERRAIAAAVAWLDRRVGPEAGTQHHVARAGLAEMSNPESQFDCIDASRNTTSLLLVLDELHLLKHHRVEAPVARGVLLDGRWPHATAVVAELAGQREWAVDSWTHPAGELPDIMPLEQWLANSH
jgi:hypothetical protein